jgi:hypothetical protein
LTDFYCCDILANIKKLTNGLANFCGKLKENLVRKLIILSLVILCFCMLSVNCSLLEFNYDVDSSKTESQSEEKLYKITFIQEGFDDVIKYVKEGELLKDIPKPAYVKGYDVKWDIEDFSRVNNDYTVNAIATVKTYVIIFKVTYGGSVVNKSINVVYGSEYSLETPTTPLGDEYSFNCWTYNGVKVDSVGVWDIDVDGYEVQLISKWKSKYSDNF